MTDSSQKDNQEAMLNLLIEQVNEQLKAQGIPPGDDLYSTSWDDSLIAINEKMAFLNKSDPLNTDLGRLRAISELLHEAVLVWDQICDCRALFLAVTDNISGEKQ